MKIYSYPSEAAEKCLARIRGRASAFSAKDVAAVQRILNHVRQKGDKAVIDYTRKFDAPGMALERLEVSAAEIAAALKKVDASFKRALNRAAEQIEAFHRQQKPRSWIDTPRDGVMVGQLVHPVDAAGIYVPGGRSGSTPLVSSVLMTAIPAKIAGVEQIVMVTPPAKDGSITPYLLAAARKAGVNRIFKTGSAWAIAALAYGTAAIPKVDVIVGPGNIYVTLAKKLVSGLVRIDMIAGPSEILVVADASADPAHVAADLLSQAEHDPLASAILVTDSAELATAVQAELARQVVVLTRREIAEQSLRSYSALFVVPDLDAAVGLANRIAPEHLELQVRDPFARIGSIRHAGALFLGPHTPEPVGDYVAGPNHVLPTAGTARFSSALSVDHFVKTTSLIHYSADALAAESADIVRIAEIEGLDAHARSVKIRLPKRFAKGKK
jgi:histidinol dehydrogenase